MRSSTWLESLPSELFYQHLSGLQTNDLLTLRKMSQAYDVYAQSKIFLDQDAAAITLQQKLLGQWISNPESMKISAEVVLKRLDHPDYDFYARLTAILLIMKKQHISSGVSQEKLNDLIVTIEGDEATAFYTYIRALNLLSVVAPDMNDAQLARVFQPMVVNTHRLSRRVESCRFDYTWSALAWRMSSEQLDAAISSMKRNASEHFKALAVLITHLSSPQLDAMFVSEMERLNTVNVEDKFEEENLREILRALLRRLSKDQIATLFAQVEKMLRDNKTDIPYTTIRFLGYLSSFLSEEQISSMFILMQEKLISNRPFALKMIEEGLALCLNYNQIDILLDSLKKALCGEDNHEDGSIPDIYFAILEKLMLRMNPQQYSEIWMLLIKNTDHDHHPVRYRSVDLLAMYSPNQKDQVSVTLEKLTNILDTDFCDNAIVRAGGALFALASQITNEQITALLKVGLNRLKCTEGSSNALMMLRTCAAAPALDDNQVIMLLHLIKSRLGNKEHVFVFAEKTNLILILKSLASRLNAEQITDVFPLLIALLNDPEDCYVSRYALETLNILAPHLNDAQVMQLVPAIGNQVLKEVYKEVYNDNEKAALLSRLVLLGKCSATSLRKANIASIAGGEWICFFAEQFAVLQKALAPVSLARSQNTFFTPPSSRAGQSDQLLINLAPM